MIKLTEKDLMPLTPPVPLHLIISDAQRTIVDRPAKVILQRKRHETPVCGQMIARRDDVHVRKTQEVPVAFFNALREECRK